MSNTYRLIIRTIKNTLYCAVCTVCIQWHSAVIERYRWFIFIIFFLPTYKTISSHFLTYDSNFITRRVPLWIIFQILREYPRNNSSCAIYRTFGIVCLLQFFILFFLVFHTRKQSEVNMSDIVSKTESKYRT